MSNLQFVKKLYNGKNCYSDHMSAEEIGLLYLKSKVEDIVVEMISKERIVFLTGNPGDGKTFIIRAIEEKTSLENVYIQTDLNKEAQYDTIANEIISCYQHNRPAIIAVNEYPFLLLCRAIKTKSVEIYREIMDVKKSAISYDTSRPLGGKIAILDLNERTLMAKERHITDEIIVKFISLLHKETTGYQVLSDNISALSNEKIRRQVVEVFELAAFGCEHFVTRDILGALAFLFTACTMPEYENEPYYSAIFQGTNKLLKSIQQFDPIYITTPSLDEALWNGEVQSGWLLNAPTIWPNDKSFDDDVEGAIECFKSIKRKYYFENTDGHSLLALQPDEIRKCADIFTHFESQRKKIKERIIHAINKLFLPSSDDRRDLHIWTTHKFDMSKDAAIAVSSKSVESNDLEILMPRPADWLKGMEYTPDHIILKHKRQDEPRLIIDVDFLRTLDAIENGYPIGLLAPQYEQAVAIFLQQLDDLGLTEDNDDDEIIIANRKNNAKMIINIQNGKYGFEEGDN